MVSAAAASPAGDNVVINELYCNSTDYYDSAEFIELYNPTEDSISLGGWILTDTGFEGTCGGEDKWRFPSNAGIPAGGFIVIARDAYDTGDEIGFYQEFGFYPDFEFVDATYPYEVDHASVPNMILHTADDTEHNDELELIGGDGYGASCAHYNEYDAIYLYESASGPLADAVEYRDNPPDCTEDTCPGVNGSDDDAYIGFPPVGISLGRNGGGVDTDNPRNDFRLMTPSPKEVNSGNVPPDVYSILYQPAAPQAGESVTISAIIKDESGLDSTKVYYSTDGGATYSAVSMTSPDSVYTGIIPGQADTAIVHYYVKAVDDSGDFTIRPSGDPYRYRVGFFTIYKVQKVFPGGDTSNYVNEPANVKGVVTAAYSPYTFYVQDGAGAYNGIRCYDARQAFTVARGDSVELGGNVIEYNGETEIYIHHSQALSILSTGNPLPATTVVSTGNLATGTLTAEQYEGVLVSVEGVTVGNDSLGYGEWEVDDGSGPCIVDDYSYYSYIPSSGDSLEAVNGVLWFANGDFKIEPRDYDDIIGALSVSDVCYSPIPPTDGFATTVACSVQYTEAVSGSLYYSTNDGASYTPVEMTYVAGQDYMYGDVPSQTDGTEVDYFVVAKGGNLRVRRPEAGSYQYYVGEATIYDVQYSTAGDSSDNWDKALNVRGIVTAAPGVYSDYYFFIQDQSGDPWTGVKVYERTGAINLSEGDEVIVCGDVWEYYDETELAIHCPSAYTIVSSGNELPPAKGVSPKVISNQEQYEGMLMQVVRVKVTNDDAGFGEWYVADYDTVTSECKVNDTAQYTYTPTLDDVLVVNGVVAYAFGEYMLEPRYDADIVDFTGNITGLDPAAKSVPRFVLNQNYPNPFNPVTSVAFQIPEATQVALSVFNISGQKVKTLVDTELPQGVYEANWDGTDDSGARVASGVYFYSLVAGDQKETKRMVLLK
jgi:hypothetical protein